MVNMLASSPSRARRKVWLVVAALIIGSLVLLGVLQSGAFDGTVRLNKDDAKVIGRALLPDLYEDSFARLQARVLSAGYAGDAVVLVLWNTPASEAAKVFDDFQSQSASYVVDMTGARASALAIDPSLAARLSSVSGGLVASAGNDSPIVAVIMFNEKGLKTSGVAFVIRNIGETSPLGRRIWPILSIGSPIGELLMQMKRRNSQWFDSGS